MVIDYQKISLEVMQSKYMLQDYDGNLVEKTPDDIFKRVSSALAKNKTEEEAFYLMLSKSNIPAGRICSNLGAGKYKPKTSTINCTVADTIHDSMLGIHQGLTRNALTLKAGCGVGTDFTPIRPSGAYVSGVGAKTSGPLPYIKVFNTDSHTIESAGARRVANMGSLEICHPDILQFVHAKKKDRNSYSYFNFSVLVTDEFMEAKRNNDDWELYFPASDLDKQLCAPEELKVKNWMGKDVLCRIYEVIKAQDLYNEIMEATFNTNDPGIIFIGTVNRLNALRCLELIRVCNPCGEQYLPPNGACLLGAQNLVNYVRNPFRKDAYFDVEAYVEDIKIMNLMLDRVVEQSGLPLDEQLQEIINKRRHGLGYYGLGSAMIMLRMKYGSRESIEFTHMVTKTLARETYKNALEFAKEYGKAPVFEDKKVLESYLSSEFIKRLDLGEKWHADALEYGLRWTHGNTIAPTGTIALTFGNNTSAGIEPSFAHSYFRHVIVKGRKTKVTEHVKSYEYLLYCELFGDVDVNDLPDYFTTATEIPPELHLRVQAEAQKYIDSSISKTINVDKNTSFKDFVDLYDLAYDLGIKGTTTYRYDPVQSAGVYTTKEDLLNMQIEFTDVDGQSYRVNGLTEIEYDGEITNGACLLEALRTEMYGKY